MEKALENFIKPASVLVAQAIQNFSMSTQMSEFI